MKRDDTKKNFTALSGNDLATVLFHYLSFPCFFAFVTISEVFCLMRYGSIQNAEFHLFCSENRNFFAKYKKRADKYAGSLKYSSVLECVSTLDKLTHRPHGAYVQALVKNHNVGIFVFLQRTLAVVNTHNL